MPKRTDDDLGFLRKTKRKNSAEDLKKEKKEKTQQYREAYADILREKEARKKIVHIENKVDRDLSDEALHQYLSEKIDLVTVYALWVLHKFFDNRFDEELLKKYHEELGEIGWCLKNKLLSVREIKKKLREELDHDFVPRKFDDARYGDYVIEEGENFQHMAENLTYDKVYAKRIAGCRNLSAENYEYMMAWVLYDKFSFDVDELDRFIELEREIDYRKDYQEYLDIREYMNGLADGYFKLPLLEEEIITSEG